MLAGRPRLGKELVVVDATKVGANAALAIVVPRFHWRCTLQQHLTALFWAAIYTVIAILIAAGVLHPSLGPVLRPESARWPWPPPASSW